VATVVERVRRDGTLGAVHSRAVLSRRTLLGLGLVALAGCGKHVKVVVPRPTPDPDAAALAEARVGEARLLAAYDAKIARAGAGRRGRLQVERAIHATHLSALHGGAAVPGAAAAIPADLPKALLASAHRLRGLALAAAKGANAALLASIAASHQASAL
jgi:hypothetical protein